MICYKDKTFCNSDCVNTDCYRNFTDEERANSIKWWEGFGEDLQDQGPPIAMADFSKDCDGYKKPRDELAEFCHK